VAVYSKADFLVSGDKALVSLFLIGRCAVISPTEFLARL
jgi:predicted nucleic acid-binding protein